jgi:hypothetical protein
MYEREAYNKEQVAVSRPSTPLGPIHCYSGHTAGVTVTSYMLAEVGINAVGFMFRSGFLCGILIKITVFCRMWPPVKPFCLDID